MASQRRASWCHLVTKILKTLSLPVSGRGIHPRTIKYSWNASSLGHTGDILEVGAFWSIRTKDIPSFDRYFSQLQAFYNDYRSVRRVSHASSPLILTVIAAAPSFLHHPVNTPSVV